MVERSSREGADSELDAPPRLEADAELRTKFIPAARDRMQSELLAGLLGLLLLSKALLLGWDIHLRGGMPGWFWVSCCFSVAFAALAWLLRAATGLAATAGALVCMDMLLRQELGISWTRTAMPALLSLFLLTFGATRFGRKRKQAMGTAEGRRGRRASQVLANLGVAGLLAANGSAAMLAACIAALAEATADTVSSEMGQALAVTRWGQPTRLITTGRPVTPGTDGGVTIAGTALGVLGAAIIVMLSPFTLFGPLAHSAVPALRVFSAACIGLLFDSLLGATLERKGWLGNDIVNFISTAVAAATAFVLMRWL